MDVKCVAVGKDLLQELGVCQVFGENLLLKKIYSRPSPTFRANFEEIFSPFHQRRRRLEQRQHERKNDTNLGEQAKRRKPKPVALDAVVRERRKRDVSAARMYNK